MRLEGRVSFVTGASRGIGLSIAERLAQEGSAVVMADIDEEANRAAARSLEQQTGCPTLAVRADVTQIDDIQRMVAAALERFGQIDVLVNNAGMIQIKPWLEIDEQDWDRIFAVNLKGAFFTQQAVARHMKARGSGRIINIASGAARRPAPNSTHYGAAKVGVVFITQSAAVDLGPYNITVNCVAPGVVASTRLWDEIGAGYETYFGKTKEQRISESVGRLPLRRPQTPMDVAAAVAFFASDDAKEITGACLDVDGGAWL